MHVVRINKPVVRVAVAATVLLFQPGFDVAEGRQTRPIHQITRQHEHAVARASSVIIYTTPGSRVSDGCSRSGRIRQERVTNPGVPASNGPSSPSRA